MYERSNSVASVTLYMDSNTDCKASAARALPLAWHEFPMFSGFSTIDPSLSLAAVKALESNSMIPIIKEELKHRIQFKRMTEGREELMIDFTEKPKAELTAEEKEKVERRREQNRMAARRFREKQNTLGIKLKRKTQELESDNTSLRNQIRELKRERAVLQCQLEGHLSVCPYVTGQNMRMSFPS
ncbi:hypothetical protein CHS0354_022818 [Potamilus streckersoni]|uniref:BZIP domain-containing protein n=1 Tax=Potamilus streckersoni TaxID=2493646 RepID=A0AAE0S2J1_9BIVA|nr:hypothetical protein CHS0354_022818 [Potamilus streckersoni]